MVAGEEDLRHRPAAELGRARVVRVLEPAVERGREALHLARAFGERARKPARDRVDERERRNLAAREDVRADRDDVGAEMIEDPLVEALEARGQQRQRLLGGELLDELLVELAALRRERDHPVIRHAAVDRVERGRDDVDAQHHPGPAAVRVVVDLPGRQRRRVAVVEDAELELACRARPPADGAREPSRTQPERA